MGQVCSCSCNKEKQHEEEEITTSKIVSYQDPELIDHKNSQQSDLDGLKGLDISKETEQESKNKYQDSFSASEEKEEIQDNTKGNNVQEKIKSTVFDPVNEELNASHIMICGLASARGDFISIVNKERNLIKGKLLNSLYSMTGYQQYPPLTDYVDKKNDNKRGNKLIDRYAREMKGAINLHLSENRHLFFIIDQGVMNSENNYYLFEISLTELLKTNALGSVALKNKSFSKFTLKELRHTIKLCVLNPNYRKYVHFCCGVQSCDQRGDPSISGVNKIISFDELKLGIGEELFAEYEKRIKNKSYQKTDDPNILPLKK